MIVPNFDNNDSSIYDFPFMDVDNIFHLATTFDDIAFSRKGSNEERLTMDT